MVEPTVQDYSDTAAQIFSEGARELLGGEPWSRFAEREEACQPPQKNRLGSLLRGLEQVYGSSAGQGLALRIGRAMFHHGLRQLGEQAGFRTIDFRMLPSARRVEKGLHSLAYVLSEHTGCRVVVMDEGQYWTWRVECCPVCQGHTASAASCFLMVGLIQEFAGWASGGRFYRVVETACHAAGADACEFHIDKKPLEWG